MYLKSLKYKFPKPSKEFFDAVISALAETDGKYTSERTKDKRENLFILYSEYIETGKKINTFNFYRLRKALAEYRDDRRLDYVTSPESETYWAS